MMKQQLLTTLTIMFLVVFGWAAVASANSSERVAADGYFNSLIESGYAYAFPQPIDGAAVEGADASQVAANSGPEPGTVVCTGSLHDPYFETVATSGYGYAFPEPIESAADDQGAYYEICKAY